MKMTFKQLYSVALAVAIFLLDAPARAQTFDFTPPGTSVSFETATNWSPLGPPGAAGTARFNANSQYSVLFNSSPQTNRLLVTEGDVTFRPLLSSPGQNTYSVLSNSLTESDGLIDGGDLTLSSNGDRRFSLSLSGRLDLGVTAGARSTLEINSNTILSTRFGNIGLAAGSSEVTVRGAGSMFNTTGNLSVGQLGPGTLTIEDGGTVSSTGGSFIAAFAGSTGAATVRGGGSNWAVASILTIGGNGFGTLTIEDGGAVSSVTAFLGANLRSFGDVTVRGVGSTWTTDQMFVGLGFGNGQLTVSEGGSVSNGIGEINNGDVTVSGAGSTFTNSGSLTAGDPDGSQLFILDGGFVSNTTGTLVLCHS